MRDVLKVLGLGKAFREYRSEWQRMASWMGVPVKPLAEHWVIRDISFRISPGEAVGIVGQNGAGKSTLLKMITGTLRQSEGAVALSGRVAAILELGMGFNPDLSGRQNAAHTAGLMGFSQSEVNAMMPEIEAFAEIGEYFDQPVRTYSSGMQMRVAFSVATAFRPEILIVDEALSVGDAYFQHKSMGRIRDFREKGTSLIIVSHDRNALQALCDRALLLDQGRLVMDGQPSVVMDYYNALIAEKENANVRALSLSTGQVQTRSGTGEAEVDSIGLYDTSGNLIEFVNVGQAVEMRIRIVVRTDIPVLVFGYQIKDRLGQDVFGTNTYHTDQILNDVRAGSAYEFVVKFDANVGVGTYSVSTALVSTDTHLVNNYEWRDLALIFNVTNIDKTYFIGMNWLHPAIEVRQS